MDAPLVTLTPPSSFWSPRKIVVGAGASGQLAAEAKSLGARRVLIVADRRLAECGLLDRFVRLFADAGVHAAEFCDVQPDPTIDNVMQGLAALRRLDGDLLVGLGGGSPMDAAKAIAVLAANEPPLAQYAGYDQVPRPGAPLILVPTTAGTGSEATRVTVITDEERSVKMMMLDKSFMATTAIVDYELSLSMPPSLTAHVGIDTMTHGIEAFVSRKANPSADLYAVSCLRLTARHLDTAYREPDNREARAGMMLAATHGGLAFSNSSVALVHGMSRPIGANFHVPHGLSNAVLLPEVTRYSLSGAAARYAEAARILGVAGPGNDEAAGHALLSYLDEQNRRLGVGRLRDVVGVTQGEFMGKCEEMADAALASGSPQNNPRVPTQAEIVELYRRAW
jgi:alcohol dehydrogenase class IV